MQINLKQTRGGKCEKLPPAVQSLAGGYRISIYLLIFTTGEKRGHAPEVVQIVDG